MSPPGRPKGDSAVRSTKGCRVNANIEREAMRQQALIAVLCHDRELSTLAGWLRADASDTARAERGLSAYRANAGASAERALAAAYPVVRQIVGDDSFAALARALWRAQPPGKGDLAQFGDTLAAFIESRAPLAQEAYLPDCARLDWALHECELAEDAADAVPGLELLARHDPQSLVLHLRPGCQLLSSRYPLATIWQAHQSAAEARFEPVRAALAAGQAEHALVWRQGWRGQVAALCTADALFTRALLQRQSLAQALDAAGPGFDFEAWLIRALQLGWLAAVSSSAAALLPESAPESAPCSTAPALPLSNPR